MGYVDDINLQRCIRQSVVIMPPSLPEQKQINHVSLLFLPSPFLFSFSLSILHLIMSDDKKDSPPRIFSPDPYRYHSWVKPGLSTLERKTLSITPPLDEIQGPMSSTFLPPSPDIIQVGAPLYPYPYLLNLLLAPDMRAYLCDAKYSEDVYALPIHLQTLISEAKEEVIIERTKQEQGLPSTAPELAMKHLQRVKDSVWSRSGHDPDNVANAVIELVRNEDELDNILY